MFFSVVVDKFLKISKNLNLKIKYKENILI